MPDKISSQDAATLDELRKEKREDFRKSFCKHCKEWKAQQQFLTEGQPTGAWLTKEFDKKFCEKCKICRCGHPKVWHYPELDSCMGNEDTCHCSGYKPLKDNEIAEWEESNITEWEKRMAVLSRQQTEKRLQKEFCELLYDFARNVLCEPKSDAWLQFNIEDFLGKRLRGQAKK